MIMAKPTRDRTDPVKFSIIINCYNTLAIIQQSVASVLESTASNSELLLVNNHPPYQEVMAYLGALRHPRVTVLDPGQNLSHILGTQFAANRARGQYLVRMDDDCVVPNNNWIWALHQALNHFPDLAYIGLPWPGIAINGVGRATAPGIEIEYADFVLFTCVMFTRRLWQAHFILSPQGIYGNDDSRSAQIAARLGLKKGYLVSHPCKHLGRTSECDPLYGAWKLFYHQKITSLDFAVWRSSVTRLTPVEEAALREFGYPDSQIETIKTIFSQPARLVD